jgi:F-type H+-transporting ATPase subunit b
MELLLAQVNLLSPSLGVIFWTALAFLLLLVLLSRFAWKPITGALEEREKTIEESITRAERALAEAKRLQADNEAARRQAEQQAQAILREAREEADRVRTGEVEKTKAHLQQLQAQAQADIERQRQQAVADLRQEVARLAVAAAEKLLGESLDDERQHRLVERFIAEMPSN